MKTALLLIAASPAWVPALMVLYFVFGQAFEVRVFWEVYPVIVALSYGTVSEWLECIQPARLVTTVGRYL